ncbi:amidohydrolase [Enemella evansiae]|uniref:amidohydrolase n=1 Tax=Enemella evansiae TaxID=2016499 RepID=UPI000B96703F|nr:amidohydrolase [Enemella evansiae]OYO18189.1 amidohydrolase [Enemella evansiae]
MNQEVSADLVLRNARITTFDSEVPTAESIAIRDGRVLAIGSDEELAALAETAARTIDLGGRSVLPGLNDSHIHAVRGGVGWGTCLQWEGIRSQAEALASVRDAVAARAPGEWISVIGGWHERQFSDAGMPTREQLDEIAPVHPVYLQELYGRAVLNSAALAAVGWDDETQPPPGAEFLRDDDGRLTGEVRGPAAYARPNALTLDLPLETAVQATAAMISEFAAHGLTGVVDAGGFQVTPHDYDALYELWRRGGLGVRFRLYICAWSRGDEVHDYEQLTLLSQPDFGDGMLKLAGLGEMPHMACHDFEGFDPDFTIADDAHSELVEICRMAVEHGWRLSVHAVLNNSLSRILDAWELVDRESGGRVSDLRWSIVHADEASEANLRRIAALGAGIQVQNRMVLQGADYVDLWGQDGADAAPPIGAMKRLGIQIGAGTDGTRANSWYPWTSIAWLVSGESIDGRTRRAEHDRLSRFDAIAAYTRDSAWFSGEEDTRGRLAPGFDADLCVPTMDPFSCSIEELRELRSELTMVGGRITHAAPAFIELVG